MRGTSRLLLAAGLWLCTASAQAHISLERASSHESRYGDGEIKDAPCGMAGGARGSNVYTYKPGATITITLDEYIPHPGYFRIAFDADGDDDFVTPASTSGEFGNCAGDPLCGAGMDDFCNNDTVLLDNLDPHPSMFGASWEWSVTLPNVECDNCTLQIIQVMNDLNVHFAPYPSDDIYYQCIDLVLSNGAPDVTDTPVVNNGIDCKEGQPTGGTGTAGMGAGTGAAGTTAGTGVGGTTAGTGGTGAAGTTAGTGAAGTGAAGVGFAGMGVGGVGFAGVGAAGTAAAGVGASGTAATPVAGTGAVPVAGSVAPPPAAGAAVPTGTTSSSSSGGCATAGGTPAQGAWVLLGLMLLGRWRRNR